MTFSSRALQALELVRQQRPEFLRDVSFDRDAHDGFVVVGSVDAGGAVSVHAEYADADREDLPAEQMSHKRYVAVMLGGGAAHVIGQELREPGSVVNAVLRRVFQGLPTKAREDVARRYDDPDADWGDGSRAALPGVLASLWRLFRWAQDPDNVRGRFEVDPAYAQWLQEFDHDSLVIVAKSFTRRPVDADDDAPQGGSALSREVERLLERHKNVVVEGVAGSGKSHLLEALVGTSRRAAAVAPYAGHDEVVVFHPSTSYEDFVCGLRPRRDGGFEGVAGVFVELCQRAAEDPDNGYLLFIDEINRANTARVLGDLLLPLEASKRARAPRAAASSELSDAAEGGAVLRSALFASKADMAEPYPTVRLQTPIVAPTGSRLAALAGDRAFSYLVVPDNLHVLGTMNTTDRSTGTIDLALRRRFQWLTVEPLGADELRAAIEGEFDADYAATLRTLVDAYSAANARLEHRIGPDARLGHSYFFQKDDSGAGIGAQEIEAALTGQLAEVLYSFGQRGDTDAAPWWRGPHYRVVHVGHGIGARWQRVAVGAPGAPGQHGPHGQHVAVG
ncbi:AAA family ATPase [Microbacterium sp. No. 7]|uniref:AAA family ATPase n=1 Tax=Microbacterium sp. No. 7 TaxID=1714373 RepID=UPI0006ED2497|nr:AAA family ATPase [Microbacterium sp. No. 7]ALJ21775.1 hypothetical protein AOA12_18500 [Microbacterium sp. No. 7]